MEKRCATRQHTENEGDSAPCLGCFGPGAVRTPESDPHGKAASEPGASEPGAKLDAGKLRTGLVLGGFAGALTEVSRVGTYGAQKYTPNGWKQVPDGEARYTDAMLRHLLAEAAGEQHDEDTGIRHAAHAAWNALARLELALRAEGAEA